MTRWKDDPEKIATANDALTKCYEGPWGLKASEEDAIFAVAEALSLSSDFHATRDEYDPLAEALYEWECGSPSPFAEGLASLVEDGLQPGSTVPVAEVAGELESASWDARKTAFILDLLQDHYDKEGKS